MSFREVADQFVSWYIHTHNTNRSALQQVYTPHSLMTYQDQQLYGNDNIMAKVGDPNLAIMQKSAVHIEAQPSINDTTLICVQGNLWFDDPSQTIPFIEIFLIAQDPATQAFFVVNQIFSTHSV